MIKHCLFSSEANLTDCVGFVIYTAIFKMTKAHLLDLFVKFYHSFIWDILFPYVNVLSILSSTVKHFV